MPSASSMSSIQSSEQATTAQHVSMEMAGTSEKKGSDDSSNGDEGSDATQARTKAPPQSEISGFKFALIMIGVCVSVFCVALDNTIISTAIPRITDEFHALQDVGWYGSAYLLTTCAFQLFFGKLYTLFNTKIVFLSALFIFELGSLICAVAPTSVALIVGRAIAGVGSAGIFSGGLIIIANITPLEKRPMYQSAMAGMFSIASVVGPLIGGAFTDKVTWRWCFYINLPMGGVTTAMIVTFLHLPTNGSFKSLGLAKSLMQLDPLGTVLFIPSITCLLLALQWGGTTYAWSDGRIITLFVIFGLALIGFIGVQYWMGESATVPPRIATQRTIAFGSLLALCVGGSLYVMIYFLPVWFQAVLGVDALQSGIDTIALVFSNTLGIFFSGGLTTALGYYMPYPYLSAIFSSVGAGLLTTLNPTSSTARWVGYQTLFGFGCGCGFQVPQIAAQTVLAPQDAPVGIATTLLFTMLGGAVFVSAGNNVFNNALVANLAALDAPGLSLEAVVAAGATQLRSVVPPELVPQAVGAYNAAVTKTFLFALILPCVSLLGALGMEWRSVKKGRQQQEQAGKKDGIVEAKGHV